MKHRELRINLDLGGAYIVGAIVKIRCHDDGTPVNMFWRRRLRDSAIDQCVEWVEDKPIKSVKKTGDKP